MNDSSSGRRGAFAAIRPRSCRTAAPLSYAQQRMWLFNQLEPGNPLYNRPRATRWTGPLDGAALERSLAEIARRHEVLKARYPLAEHGPVQEVATDEPFHLALADFTAGSRDEREDAAHRWMVAEAARPFTLTEEPPFRAFLLRLAPEEHLLLLVLHHIASDRWSRALLLRELLALYPALVSGRPSPLPELRIQYADYAEWQQQRLQGAWLLGELAYWREKLSGAPAVLTLPTHKPRPAAQTHVGGLVSFALRKDLVEALTDLARREHATTFMVILAGFKALWARATGQTDLMIGVPVAGRVRVELENLIGCFANTLVLRADLSGDPTFREAVGRVREATLGAFDHQELPFEKLVAELRPRRDPSYHPLFQVLFNSQLDFASETVNIPGLRIAEVEIDLGAALVDLAVDFKLGRDCWLCHFTFNSELLDEPLVAKLADQYRMILEAAVSDPEQRLSALPRPPAAAAPDEYERLLQDLDRISEEEAERLLAAESSERSREGLSP